MTQKKASLFIRILLVFISTIATLSVFELILRVTGFENNPLKVRSNSGNDFRYFHVFEDDNYVYDPQLIWRPKPGYRVFNNQGFRGPELSMPKPHDSFRIFAVGDSNTLGWFGRFGNWPAYLQRMIDSDGRNAVVVNAGAYGYTSYQGLLRFQESLDYDPDIVLISFGANDAHQVHTPDKEYSAKEMTGAGFLKFLKNFRVGKLILFVGLIQKTDSNSSATLVPRVSLQEYRQNLESIISIAKAHHVQPIFLTRPYIGTSKDPKFWKYYAPLYYDVTKQVAASHGVLLIDVYKDFKEKDNYFADESHFTHAGHRVAAGYIYAALKPLIPLKNNLQSSNSSSGTTSGAFTSGSSSRTKTPR